MSVILQTFTFHRDRLVQLHKALSEKQWTEDATSKQFINALLLSQIEAMNEEIKKIEQELIEYVSALPKESIIE